jgi:hypothetical protein
MPSGVSSNWLKYLIFPLWSDRPCCSYNTYSETAFSARYRTDKQSARLRGMRDGFFATEGGIPSRPVRVSLKSLALKRGSEKREARWVDRANLEV